ncbi:MAG: hypothetical protein LUC88_01935 [Prevotella sp.]|nr:hypothetical protein [Prevotella sp.]
MSDKICIELDHHYAVTQNDQLVNIRSTHKEDGNKYYCPYCKQEMIGKRGSKREWHFAHKVKPCSYDKYLHSLAERRIKDWFNQNELIDLNMSRYNTCDQNFRCPFYCKDKCSSLIDNKPYNLKKYFGECELEHKFGGFIADIFCHNKTYEAKPLFIEINVNHECTEEKKDSGIHIIELKINSEEDIDKIVGSTSLYEGPNVKLYNFKQMVNDSEKFSRSVLKYCQVSEIGCHLYIDEYNCKNYNESHQGCYEITMPTDKCEDLGISEDRFKKMCQAITYKKRLSRQNCDICAYKSKEPSNNCFLYTKGRVSQDQRKYNGALCPKFCESKFLLNKAEQALNIYGRYLSIWSREPRYDPNILI